MRDGRLVALAVAGDSAAFETLVRRHLRAAYAVAYGELGDPADAEDASQDAFITALEHLEDCREPDRFQAWLLQIVRNRARSLRRKRTIRTAAPLETATTVADGGPRPDAEAARAEIRDRLEVALKGLPQTQREVVLLHDLEGWRHREIAERLGLPEGTIRSHLFHARRALRRTLPQHASEEEHGA